MVFPQPQFMCMISIKTFHCYLSNRWHRTKINKQFSSWEDLIYQVPLGSVLGAPLLNIYVKDVSYLAESTIFCNCADYKIFYACNKDLDYLINRLMKVKKNKISIFYPFCDLSTKMFGAQIGEPKIWESKKQKLMGVEIDRTLSFDECVASLYRKTGKKLPAYIAKCHVF